MSGTDGRDEQAAGSPRRVTPVTSIVMLVLAGIVWFFLHNLASLHLALELLVAAVVGLVAGFVVQEVAARRRR